MTRWTKSSRSQSTANCVEVTATLDRIRDSKDPHGPTLRADVTTFVHAIKTGRFNR